MNKLIKYVKSEVDVEIFSCMMAMVIIFTYGALLYIYGEKSMKFSIIFWMLILSYISSWAQKLLFIKDRVYEKKEFVVRAVLWIVIPFVFSLIMGSLLKWFVGYPTWIFVSYYIVLGIYLVGIWFLMQFCYKSESDELNEMLHNLKRNEFKKRT